MVEGNVNNKNETRESDQPESTENDKVHYEAKEARNKLMDIVFGNEGQKGDTRSSDCGENTDTNSEREKTEKDGADYNDNTDTRDKFREFLNTLFGDDIESKNEIISDEEEEEKNPEGKELSPEEIDALQKKAIKEAFERIANGEELTDAEKGNLGEMLMDQYYISQGYRPIHEPRVTDLSHKSGKGIDGVYEKVNHDVTKSYVIAEAKVNSSKLNKGLADGTDQMSDEWVDNRLDKAVGKEKADEIRNVYEDSPERISKELYHFDYSDSEKSASADISTVDESGNPNKDNILVQVFDKDGNEVEGGNQNDQR